MSDKNVLSRGQQVRWIRPDANRWMRPDAVRYLSPDANAEEVFPALNRKYSPSQPRTPAGNGIESGRWTARTRTGGSNMSTPSDNASPMGNTDFGDLTGSSDLSGLFEIAPSDFSIGDFTQLAGDPPRGMGDNGGPPLESPEIPTERPATGGPLMTFIRAGAAWVGAMGRNAAAVDVFFGMLKQIDETNAILNTIKSANDPPKSLEELQERVGLPTDSGYEDHHIVNQHAGNRSVFGDEAIDSPNNLARIPVLKHIEISRWYSSRSDRFGGLSPRDFLRDKSWDEQMQVGLDIMRAQGVLK